MKRRVIPALLLAAALLAGCAPGGAAGDFSLPNDRYSYEKVERPALPHSAFSPYDEAYYRALREEYGLEELTAGCTGDFEQVREITRSWP